MSALARSKLYRLFALVLDYPDEALRNCVASGELADTLQPLLTQACPAVAAQPGRDTPFATASLEDLAADYSCLFDVGRAGKPPCPLNGSAWHDETERLAVMEEVLRFYNHFGLVLNPQQHELPDHLGAELEFLHFLAYRQHELLAAGADSAPFRHAELDFLARHPARWIPDMRRELERAGSGPFYRQLIGLLDDTLCHLAAASGQPSDGIGLSRVAGAT